MQLNRDYSDYPNAFAKLVAADKFCRIPGRLGVAARPFFESVLEPWCYEGPWCYEERRKRDRSRVKVRDGSLLYDETFCGW